VHFVHQDDNGYYWFCTDAGISRYNGYEFTNFTTADGLTNNVVFKCFEDWDGNLWFTCIDGSITIYNQTRKEFTKYENSDWLRSKYSLQKWTHHIGFREKTKEVWFFMLRNLQRGSAIYSVDKNGQRDSTIISDFRFKVHSKFDNFHIIKFRRVMTFGFFVPVLEASLPLGLNYKQIIDASNGASTDRLIHYRSLVSEAEDTYNSLMVSSKDGYRVIDIRDLVYLKSESGSYCVMYFTDGSKEVVSKPLNYFEALLPADRFYRIYRSHLVNLKKVKSFNAKSSTVKLSVGIELVVSIRKKADFRKKMSN
jgi:hypothetical protein